MSEAQPCTTSLLEDSPEHIDQFTSHTRVAKAICNLITTEGGGRCIGLEGIWGSGKSTIINLIQDQINEETSETGLPPKYKVIIYDAWEHQGDPLHHTFLSALTSELVEPETEEISWLTRLDELLARTSHSTTLEHPRMSRWQKLLLTSILVAPVGIALYANGLKDGVVLGNQGFGWAAQCNWGLALLSLPLVIAGLQSLVRRFCKGDSSGTNDDCWSLFINKPVMDVRNVTTQKPDVTSIGFRDYFGDLVQYAVEGKKEKNPLERIVLVLDNLDRIPQDDALSIWSALQIFLSASEHKPPAWSKKLWVLIPFDRCGINRLWTSVQPLSEKTSPEKISRSDNGKDIDSDGKKKDIDSNDKKNVGKEDFDYVKGNGDLATHFLDKTLQVCFEVPPPVFSDWRDYLSGCLERAFKKHSRGEFHEIGMLFGLFHDLAWAQPTPRLLKLFVNQIGTLHRQWPCTEIPLLHMATYVLLRREKTVGEIIRGLRVGNLFVGKEQALAFVGGKIHINLAAMAFNVRISKAYQLLLEPPIQKAIDGGNARELWRLSSVYPEGFWKVLETVLCGEWLSGQKRIANSANCLAFNGGLQRHEMPETKSILRSIRDSFDGMKHWILLEENGVDGLISLMHLLPDEAIVNHIIDLISTSPIERGSELVSAVDPSKIEQWVCAVIGVLQQMEKMGFAKIYSKGIKIPTDATGYIQACARLKTLDIGREYWPVLLPGVPLDSVISALSSSYDIDSYVAAIQFVKETQPAFPWSRFVDSNVHTLQQLDQQYPPNQIVALLRGLWEIQDQVSHAGKALENISHGYALHYLVQAYGESQRELVALCLITFFKGTPDCSMPTDVSNTAMGYELMKRLVAQPEEQLCIEVAGLVEEYRQLDLMFGVLNSATITCELAFDSIRRLSRTPDTIGLFTPELVAGNWLLMETKLSRKNLDKLTKRLLASVDIAGHVSGKPFDMKKIGLYATLVRLGCMTQSKFRKFCIAGLKNISSEEWKSQWDRNCAGELAVDMVDQGSRFALGNNYQKALLDHANEVADKESVSSYLHNDLPKLLILLPSTSRMELKKDLLTIAVNKGRTICKKFIELYGDELASREIIRRNPRVVSHLFIPLVKSRHPSGLPWLSRIFHACPGLLNGYKPEHPGEVRRFKQLVEDKVLAGQKQGTESIMQIAEALKVRNSKQRE